ncbi:leucine-rich repeat-containing protein 14B isoform X2 [Columba livia]|uniref:Leucine-rich repeat-containing protein 14B n=1 Tax=Columba livia TaxID=8932 RepID=A0A2I0M4V4_COLLI|nr:leucine-rich repeat-containing protein 14B isoform X2 [Columba livia]PKK24711.1 leucine rich repeat containing 14B, transcript variant X2 [Columba livia]
MKSLRFISAEAFVSNAEFARKSLSSIAHNLFPLLFKASYLLEQGEVIHDLVKNWPLVDFNVGKLLGTTVDYQEDLSHRTCTVCLESCLTGLRDYVLNHPSPYVKRLKVVDLTERNYELVVQALLKKCYCPLKICCVSFRSDNLALQKFFYIIKLTEPSLLRKLEIVHNVRLEMEHLEILFNSIHFPLLMSLTLPARTFNVRRFTATDEQMLTNIGEKLGEMTQLTELSMPFSILTGRIQGLLSPLKTPLKKLNVSNCSLNHADMAYLANSFHVNHLEALDLSGHNIPDLYPSTFFKLLSHSSSVLRSLTLEDCNIQDTHVNMLILGLSPCQKLEEFKFLGNPLSSHALKQLFTFLRELPMLKNVEFPVPMDCYPIGITYPIDDVSLCRFDHQKYESVAEELKFILLQANREDVKASTPFFGSYDAAVQETNNELGAYLIKSFKEAVEKFTISLNKMS